MTYEKLIDLCSEAKGPFTCLDSPDEVQIIEEHEFGGNGFATYDAPVWVGVDQSEYDHDPMAETTWGFIL